METHAAIEAMSALAHPTRLATFARLAREADGGVPAGELADAVGAAANTMSAHLAILARAGLVAQQRAGKNVLYSAVPARVRQLSDFLETLAAKER